MFYAPECGLCWWMFHMSLRKLYTLHWLYEVVYWRQQTKWLMMLFNSTTSLLIFRLLDVSICDGGVLESPANTVDGFISPCSSIHHCLTNFDPLLLGSSILKIDMSSGGIDPFIITPLLIPDSFLCPDSAAGMPGLSGCRLGLWSFSTVFEGAGSPC